MADGTPRERTARQASSKTRREEHEEVTSSATPAGHLVQYGCCTGSTVLLAGTVGAPLLASDCCREELTSFDCWVWVVVAIGTLVYFRFLAEPSEVEDLQGVRDIRDVPDRQDKYRRLDTEDKVPLVAARAVVDGVPVPASKKPVDSELEPQQPVPTCEICIQTDEELPSATSSSASSSLPTAPSRSPSGNLNNHLINSSRALAESSLRSLQVAGVRAQVHMVGAVDGIRQATKRPPRPPLARRHRELVDARSTQTDAEAPSQTPPRLQPEVLHAMLPPLREGTDEDGLGWHPLGSARRGSSGSHDMRSDSARGDVLEATSSSVSEISANSQMELLGGGQCFDDDPPPPRQCLPRCLVITSLVMLVPVLSYVAVKRYKPELAGDLERRGEHEIKPIEPQLHGAEHQLQHFGNRFGHWAAGVGESVGIRPAQDPNTFVGKPQWHHSEWSTCSEECGTGERRRVVYCINGDTLACNKTGKAPPSSKSCTEKRGCKWDIFLWGRCDTTCGSGVMVRQVTCKSGDCKELGTKPPTVASCTQAHGCRWDAQPWEECDNQCGHGMRTRTVTCGNGPLEFCLQHGDMPNSTMPCHSVAGCKWAPDDWTPCTSNCGNGRQSRNISCANGATALCKKTGARPRQERACHDVSGCEWLMSEWSACSTTCGTGKQNRSVGCRNGWLEECLENSVLPPEEQSCHAYEGCTWDVGDWGYCDAECGSGYRRREVTCHNGALEDCKRGPVHIPEAAKPCVNTSGCEWATGPWGPCSNVCGNGSQFRVVSCSNGRENSCRNNSLPPDSRQSCMEISGCVDMASGPACNCWERDVGLQLAGALSAVGGWVLAFAILHEMVSRAALAGGARQRAVGLLFSPPAVLIAGIGALATSSVLHSGFTLLAFKGHAALLMSSQLTVGIVGLLLWLISLCGVGFKSWSASRPLRFFSAIVLLAFCGLVIWMAAGHYSPVHAAPGPASA